MLSREEYLILRDHDDFADDGGCFCGKCLVKRGGVTAQGVKAALDWYEMAANAKAADSVKREPPKPKRSGRKSIEQRTEEAIERGGFTLVRELETVTAIRRYYRYVHVKWGEPDYTVDVWWAADADGVSRWAHGDCTCGAQRERDGSCKHLRLLLRYLEADERRD